MELSSFLSSPNVPNFSTNGFSYQQQNSQDPLNANVKIRSLDRNSKKFFLVQFSRHPQNLIHAILTQNQISWPMDCDVRTSNIFINDGRQVTPGRLLLAHENENFMKTEFQKLKLWSFQKGFDERDKTTTIGANDWILVLYTCHRANVVYTVINNRDTFHGIQNPYADVVCYLNFGENIYQAIIVRKSQDYGEILDTLTALKNSSLELEFPLKHFNAVDAIPPPGFQSFCGTVEEFLTRTDCYNYAHLDESLTRLEKKMRSDALMFLDWISALEHMKRKADEQRTSLERLQNFTDPREFMNALNTLQSSRSSEQIP